MDNTKELHIYMGYINYKYWWNDICITLQKAYQQLNTEEKRVDTTQPHVLSTRWLRKGYIIFVYMLDGRIVRFELLKSGIIDIKDENGNDVTDKEIRVAHNLSRILFANVFGKAVEIYD